MALTLVPQNMARSPAAVTIPGCLLRCWLSSPTPDLLCQESAFYKVLRLCVGTVTCTGTLLECMVQGSATSTLPGSLFKRQISGFYPQSMESECLEVRPRCPCFSSSQGDLYVSQDLRTSSLETCYSVDLYPGVKYLGLFNNPLTLYRLPMDI